jgi:hypothetical protein
LFYFEHDNLSSILRATVNAEVPSQFSRSESRAPPIAARGVSHLRIWAANS